MFNRTPAGSLALPTLTRRRLLAQIPAAGAAIALPAAVIAAEPPASIENAEARFDRLLSELIEAFAQRSGSDRGLACISPDMLMICVDPAIVPVPGFEITHSQPRSARA